MSGAATIIITTIPPRRASVNALEDECVAIANDVLANVHDLSLNKLSAAVVAGNWLEVDLQMSELGVIRPYVQQS